MPPFKLIRVYFEIKPIIQIYIKIKKRTNKEKKNEKDEEIKNKSSMITKGAANLIGILIKSELENIALYPKELIINI
jgi:hypothetical protein